MAAFSLLDLHEADANGIPRSCETSASNGSPQLASLTGGVKVDLLIVQTVVDRDGRRIVETKRVRCKADPVKATGIDAHGRGDCV